MIWQKNPIKHILYPWQIEEIKVGIEEIAHEIIVELLGLIGQKYSSLNQ